MYSGLLHFADLLQPFCHLIGCLRSAFRHTKMTHEPTKMHDYYSNPQMNGMPQCSVFPLSVVRGRVKSCFMCLFFFFEEPCHRNVTERTKSPVFCDRFSKTTNEKLLIFGIMLPPTLFHS